LIISNCKPYLQRATTHIDTRCEKISLSDQNGSAVNPVRVLGLGVSSYQGSSSFRTAINFLTPIFIGADRLLLNVKTGSRRCHLQENGSGCKDESLSCISKQSS